MKNLAKSSVAFLAAIFVLGGTVAIASVSNCGAPCDIAAEQAAALSASLKQARAEQLASQVSPSTVQ